MSEYEDAEQSRIIVRFSSSPRAGSEGWSVTVMEGADGAKDSESVMALAKRLRQEAIDAIKPVGTLVDDLEASLAGNKRNDSHSAE